MKKTIFAGALAIFIAYSDLNGQDTLQISREEILLQVSRENYDLRIAQKQTAISTAQYRESNALILPSVSLSHTAITTNNPLMAFGSKLNQEAISPADFNPALLNDPDRVNNYATELLILQPLLNLDGVYGRRAAKVQQNAFQLQELRTAEYLELEVAKLYMQLQLSYEMVAVLKKAEASAAEAYRMVKDFYDQGMIQRADLLDAQLRLGEVRNQLKLAITQVKLTSDQLTHFMGFPLDGRVYAPSAPLDEMSSAADFSTDLPQDRKDIQSMKMSVAGREQMLKSSYMKFLPKINAFGSFQLYDDQLFGSSAGGYVIGARLSWDLFDGYSSISNNTKARLEVEKAVLEQEQYVSGQQAELLKANRMYLDASNAVALTEMALGQADEAYRIRKDRFAQGLERTTDLLVSEAQLFQKELAYKQAIAEYNFTKEYLHFLTR